MESVLLVTVGIFWVYQSTVFGVAEKVDTQQKDSLGKVDSNYQHWDVWEGKPSPADIPAALLHIEYFEVPRGRVIYDSYREKYIIFADKTLKNKENRKQILAFFSLDASTVVWASDPHYTTNTEELDDLF